VYPTLEDICLINRQMIERSGGSFFPPDNLLYSGKLDYLLASIAGPIFGHDRYPTLHEKAAGLTERIIVGHIFHDGNKRTGVAAGWAFLGMNKISIVLDETIADLAVALAERTATFQDVLQWFRAPHQVDKDLPGFEH
jgi:death on curing protein